MLGVEGDDAAAGGAAGGLDAHAVAQRNGQQAVGICLAQILLREEGQLVQIVYRADVAGLHALLLHEVAVVRHILIHALHRGDEALILPGPDLLAAGALDFRLIISLHGDRSFRGGLMREEKAWPEFRPGSLFTIPFYCGKVNRKMKDSGIFWAEKEEPDGRVPLRRAARLLTPYFGRLRHLPLRPVMHVSTPAIPKNA